MIRFHLAIVPPTATSQGAGKRIVIVQGRPMFFKNNKVKSAESDLTLLSSPHRPSEPFNGPLSLKLDFVWPWRKSEPKWRVALGRVPHTSKPDCSNIVKTIEDCLTKLGFWNDDSQVADLQVTKAWGDQVGIFVEIEELPQADRPSPAAVPKAMKPKTGKLTPPTELSLF